MFNFVLLMLSFLFLGLPPQSDYHVIIAETNEAETVVAQTADYQLVFVESEYTLLFADGIWRRDLNISDDYRLICFNKNCLLFYYSDEYLYLIEYDQSGNKIYDDLIINNRIDEKWNVFSHDFIYIVGGISHYQDERFIAAAAGKILGGIDAFILKLNKDHKIVDIVIFGGEKNEGFLAMVAGENEFYLVGYKNPGGGGDFGNGGRYINTVFVLALNNDLSIINYRILSSNQNVVLYEYYKDRLILILSGRIYKFDDNLNTLYRDDFEKEIIGAYLSPVNLLALFSPAEGYIYNIYTFVCEYDFSYPPSFAIRILDKSVYLQTQKGDYVLDIAYLKYFQPPDFYCPEIEYRDEVFTLFGRAQFVREESEPFFDPTVYGQYQKKYIFTNLAGIEFSVEHQIDVLLEVNVDNEGIYPIGYRLQFTGIAYLNGKNIINNYRLDQAGEYLLELHGTAGDIQRIKFDVGFDQLIFSDMAVKFWDIEANTDDVFYFEFDYNGDDECKIIDVIINDQEIDDLLVDRNKKKIDVKMRAPTVPGIYYYYLEKINYRYQDNYFSYNLNQIISVNVLKPPPQISISANDDLIYRFELFDSAATIRYFTLTTISRKDEYYQKYSLANNNLYLNGLSPNEDYRIKLSLVYQIGNRVYREIELFEVLITGRSDYKFGEIEILEKAETLKQFRIKLNKNNIISVTSQGENLYVNKNKPQAQIALTVTGLFILMVIVAYFIKKYFIKRKIKVTFS